MCISVKFSFNELYLANVDLNDCCSAVSILTKSLEYQDLWTVMALPDHRCTKEQIRYSERQPSHHNMNPKMICQI